jgi:hypothetical protein
MVVPLSGDYGFHIVDASEVFAGISDLQELEIGPCDPTAPGNIQPAFGLRKSPANS